MAYYETCPQCGSNLDPGEKCDCQNQKLFRRGRIEKGPQVREHHTDQSTYNTVLFYQTRTEMSRGSSV